MGRRLDVLLSEGEVGRFWLYDAERPEGPTEGPYFGHIENDGGWVYLELLSVEPLVGDQLEISGAVEQPDAIIGVVDDTQMLILEVLPMRVDRKFGGGSGVRRRFRGRTVIDHAPQENLQSICLRALTVRFPGIETWSGVTASHEEPEIDESGRLQAFKMTLRRQSLPSATLSDGGTLEIMADWETEGPEGRRTLVGGTALTISHDEPVTVERLLKPLFRIQELLSFLHRGFVKTDLGFASLDFEDTEPPLSRPRVWNGRLMTPHVPTLPEPERAWPFVTLDQIGGVEGLARWIDLSAEHPRAFSSLLSPYRLGEPHVENAVVAVSASIDNWVAAHSKTEEWAAKPKGVKNDGRLTERLAEHLGDEFEAWVGNAERWACALRQSCNAVKHKPSMRLDLDVLSDLVLSGRAALAAATLDAAAGSSAPSTAIFGHPSHRPVGERLRRYVETLDGKKRCEPKEREENVRCRDDEE